MTVPIDLLTDPVPGKEISTASEYVMKLQEKLKTAHHYVKDTLKIGAERQKKQYDCRVTEFTYKQGDLVWRNQKKVTPGMKCKISRHWTGPWIITEKICDLLSKLQYAQNSSPVVVHGDNIKPYVEPEAFE